MPCTPCPSDDCRAVLFPALPARSRDVLEGSADPDMRTPPPTGTNARLVGQRGWLLVIGWCGMIALGFVIVASIMTSRMAAERERGVARRADRSASAEQVAETAAGGPDLVTAGIYVERIFDVSIPDSSWSVDFYIWFRLPASSDRQVEHFRVVNGSRTAPPRAG
jgi:hypothetical protein